MCFIKKIFIFYIPFVSVIFRAGAQNSLSGIISDARSNLPLAGATVSIPDIKKGALANDSGRYFLNNLPPGNFVVQVSYVGYSTVSKSVSVRGNPVLNFSLSPSVVEQNEVVVTGVSIATEIRRNTTPMQIISKQTLLETPSTNLVDAIARQPGISAVSTGPGISKPQIRGLGYNRVVVMNDGIRQEGQQWGDEHGIEIDEYSANKIEVLKGPGSIMYGSDALAGVINIFSPDPVGDGKIRGNLVGNYQTNNGLAGYSGSLTGNQNGFVWLGRFSGKNAHDYKNKYDGFVYNSGLNEWSAGGYAGLNKSWGYSHINFSVYDLKIELPEGERDSSGAFLKPVPINDSTIEEVIADDEDFHSYSIAIPHQHIRHYKLSWMNNVYVGASKLYFNIGYQNNQRKEFGDPLKPEQPGLHFFLTTIPYDVRFTFPQLSRWNITIGSNGMYQHNENKGSEFLVPDYDLFDAGIFAFAQKYFDQLTVSGGIRFDNRSMNTHTLILDEAGIPVPHDDSISEIKFEGKSLEFSALSASVGASYEASEVSVFRINVARGFRAPNIAELGANGKHEGTFRYEIGNPLLKAETSLQFDGGYELATEHVSAVISVFDNIISNFIFPEKVSSPSGGDSLVYDQEEGTFLPIFKYSQGNANLYGGEISADIHPHPFDWLHFENSFSFVKAIQRDQPDSAKYLPFIPAHRINSELRLNAKKLNTFLRDSYISFGFSYHFDQNNVYRAYGTETSTPGYALINASAGTDVYSKKHLLFSLYFIVSNLTDVAYQDHLSRLKYAPLNPATGKTGIYNMGRNISLRLNVPVDFK